MSLAGNVAQWVQYTTGPYRNIEISDGNHYFVSTHYRQVCELIQILSIYVFREHINELNCMVSWLSSFTGVTMVSCAQVVDIVRSQLVAAMDGNSSAIMAGISWVADLSARERSHDIPDQVKNCNLHTHVYVGAFEFAYLCTR